LADPTSAIRTSISAIAKAAAVSEPTVNRFCRSLGCEGYPDFKVKLAQELGNGLPKMAQDVEIGDSTAALVAKIFASTHASLQATQAVIDPIAIERAVAALTNARSIVFFGLGASGPVALDAQHKFFRCNVPVVAHLDVLNQRMVSAGLSVDDVAVCISYTGRTVQMLDVARLAKTAGATVIGITAGPSPLAHECDIVLGVDTPEDTELYTPMTSRIAHLVLVDVLATAVSLQRGPSFSEHLKRIKDSVRDTRVPK
jgi:RpiR family carbohydrate utilization transcriptional regulator